MNSEIGKEAKPIEAWKNEAGKRVCDVNEDHTVVVIALKGCITRITANENGTLKIENLPYKKAS
ncbi:hypothetical protein MKC73_14010 [[Clostridium] innocuum]|nr:hypothetical protein [[Clostridium] innocuum]